MLALQFTNCSLWTMHCPTFITDLCLSACLCPSLLLTTLAMLVSSNVSILPRNMCAKTIMTASALWGAEMAAWWTCIKHYDMEQMKKRVKEDSLYMYVVCLMSGRFCFYKAWSYSIAWPCVLATAPEWDYELFTCMTIKNNKMLASLCQNGSACSLLDMEGIMPLHSYLISWQTFA